MMPIMGTEEVTFSTLLRSPGEVIARLVHGDVILHRRGERALRLALADRAEDRDVTGRLVVRMLADTAANAASRDALLGALRRTLAWIDLLPADAQDEFLAEFLRTAEAAGDVGTFAPVAQLLRAWEETAAIYADPELFEQRTRPLPGHAGSVAEPSVNAVA